MAHLGDAVVSFPIQSSSSLSAVPPGVYVKVVQQASATRTLFVYHPGGQMTGSLMVASRNVNRLKVTILNSGSLSLGVSHGQSFDPRSNPPTTTSHWDNIIIGTVTLQGNQGVQPSVDFEERQPVFTGEYHVAWFGSGTLSGSTCVFTEYFDQP